MKQKGKEAAYVHAVSFSLCQSVSECPSGKKKKD